MNENTNKTKNKREKGGGKDSFLIIFLAILFFIVIGFLIFKNIEIYSKKAKLENYKKLLIKEIESLKKRKLELRKNIKETTKKGYIEKEAREKLNFKKIGEKVIVISRQSKQSENKIEEKSKEKKISKIENFINWLSAKFGIN